MVSYERDAGGGNPSGKTVIVSSRGVSQMKPRLSFFLKKLLPQRAPSDLVNPNIIVALATTDGTIIFCSVFC